MQAFLVLLFAYTLSQFYRSFMAVIAGDLARDIGLDAAGLGSVSATWFVAFALAQFPVGFALDRIGPRATLSGLMLAAVLGAVWLAAAQSFGECLAAMTLIGIGCAPALMASMYVFGRLYALDRFAILSSTIIGLGTVGNLLGATPLALAVERFGWRGSMLIVAALTALSALLIAMLLRNPPPVASRIGAALDPERAPGGSPAALALAPPADHGRQLRGRDRDPVALDRAVPRLGPPPGRGRARARGARHGACHVARRPRLRADRARARSQAHHHVRGPRLRDGLSRARPVWAANPFGSPRPCSRP